MEVSSAPLGHGMLKRCALEPLGGMGGMCLYQARYRFRPGRLVDGPYPSFQERVLAQGAQVPKSRVIRTRA